MKRFLAITFLGLLFAGMVFAQSISENMATYETQIDTTATVDISEGKSSSTLVDAAFNKDGNLVLTYEGTDAISVRLTGSLVGTLIVNNDNSDMTLVLDNVTIQGTTLPAIQFKSATTVTLYSASWSSNTISDSADNTKKGAITSSGSVIIDGAESGTITLNVFKKHGLKTDGGVTVNGGNLIINGDVNAEGNMVSADLFFVMNDGNVTINALGNVHATESKGIKVNGIEGTGAGLGQIEINGGNLTIYSVGKALTAGWKVAEDATTQTTEDDPIPNVYINGGNINITTTGTPYEYSDEESCSPEGIEAKNSLYINGGTIHAVTTDDALNAGTSIVINGGYVYALSSQNDAIDSNGTIEFNGGTVICLSSAGGAEQAFDCDSDMNFTYTGGTFIGAGDGNNLPGSSSTTGYALGYGNTTFHAGDQIAVLDSNGNVVLGFVVPYELTDFTSLVIGTDSFTEGQSYTIALGAFEGTNEDGLAESGTAFKANEEVVTMDITDHVVSEGYIGMNMGGNAGGFGGLEGFGGFGGQRPDMEAGFDPAQRGNRGGFFSAQAILSILTANASEVTLPEGVTIADGLDSEDAINAVIYLLYNHVDETTLQDLLNGSMENGEFGQPQMPGGTFNP